MLVLVPASTATPAVWHGEPGRRRLQVACEGDWRYLSDARDFALDILAELVTRGSGLVARKGCGGDRGVGASSTATAIGWNVPGRAVRRVGLQVAGGGRKGNKNATRLLGNEN